MHKLTQLGPRGLPVSYQVRDVRISPGVVLAPMEGVTDRIFRRLIRRVGGAGMTCTEFVPGRSLHAGHGKPWDTVQFDDDERPISVQIYGRDPLDLADGALVVQDLGATFLDINMGCPSKKVCSHSGGSSLLREPLLVAEIVRAVRKAVTMPMTVKMRTGFDLDQKNGADIAYICQEEGAEAVTMHWRTRADLYGGQRDIEQIALAVQRLRIPVIGNGDIVDIASAEAMFRDTGCDGLMIGRGAMGDPWVFHKIASWLRGEDAPHTRAVERIGLLHQLLDDLVDHLGPGRKALGKFKQVSKYFSRNLPDAGFQTAEELTMAILHAEDVEEVEGALLRYRAALRNVAA